MRLPFQKKEKRSELSEALSTNRIRTLLSVLLIVAGITTGAFAIFPAIHSAPSSHVRSVPTVAAGASVRPAEEIVNTQNTGGATFATPRRMRPLPLIRTPGTTPGTTPTTPPRSPYTAATATGTVTSNDSRKSPAGARMYPVTKSVPSARDTSSVATRVASSFGEETEEPPPGTTTTPRRRRPPHAPDETVEHEQEELELGQLFRVRYLRGASSTKNEDDDRDHDHDHSRLLAVARIGQKPTMDKPNKYFNLFWTYLLISILGMSSYVVRTAGKPLELPTWAGLTTEDIDTLTYIQRKELITKYNNNKQTARVRRAEVGSCMNASFVKKLTPREQQYIAKYFDKIGKDGRYLVNWHLFAQDILNDCKSTTGEKFWARVILEAFNHAEYDPDIYAEWHHLTPLCMYGSVEDARNYIRLPPGWHLKVHFALCFFFPTHLPLAYSVEFMLNGNKKRLVNKISKEEFERYMNDVGNISTAFAEARIRWAQEKSEMMQNNHLALIVTNASRDTERKRLTRQRKELREAGVVELFGDFTQFEVDLYCRRWPHLVGQLTFNHFPRSPLEREHERNKNYQSMEQLTLQPDTDIVIWMGRSSSPANNHFNEVVAGYFDDHEAMPTRTNQPGGPKQVLKEEIVNQLIAEGYRFVIGYKPKTENLSSYEKANQRLSIVQASVERATLKVESGFTIIRKYNLRNSKVRPAKNLNDKGTITYHFKKRKNPPDNII